MIPNVIKYAVFSTILAGMLSPLALASDGDTPRHKKHFSPLRSEKRIEKLSEVTGISETELKAELKAGKSVLEIAEDHDLSDEVVSTLKEMRKKMKKMLWNQIHKTRGHVIEKLAEKLGMTKEELKEAIKSGKSPRELALEAGIDFKAFVKSLIEEWKAAHDEEKA